MDDYRLHPSAVADFPAATIWRYRKLYIFSFYSLNVRLSFINAPIMGHMSMMGIKKILKPLKQITMNHINIRKLGSAFGITGALLYFGCTLTMLILGHDSTVNLFNTLLHGLDVSSIIRMNISFVEVLTGLVQTFILCWLIGACIAGIYNISFNKKSSSIQ